MSPPYILEFHHHMNVVCHTLKKKKKKSLLLNFLPKTDYHYFFTLDPAFSFSYQLLETKHIGNKIQSILLIVTSTDRQIHLAHTIQSSNILNRSNLSSVPQPNRKFISRSFDSDRARLTTG